MTIALRYTSSHLFSTVELRRITMPIMASPLFLYSCLHRISWIRTESLMCARDQSYVPFIRITSVIWLIIVTSTLVVSSALVIRSGNDIEGFLALPLHISHFIFHNSILLVPIIMLHVTNCAATVAEAHNLAPELAGTCSFYSIYLIDSAPVLCTMRTMNNNAGTKKLI